MDEAVRKAVQGQEAYVVGGAVRDELLGRDVVDLDVARRRSRTRGARATRRAGEGLHSSRSPSGTARGVSRSAPGAQWTSRRCETGRSRTDLASRDFTINAIARPVDGGEDDRSAWRSAPTWRHGCCARSRRRSSRTIRCGCCVRCGSRTSSAFASTRAPSVSCTSTPALATKPRGRTHSRGARAPLAGRISPGRGARRAPAAGRLHGSRLEEVTSSTRRRSCSSLVFGERLERFRSPTS